MSKIKYAKKAEELSSQIKKALKKNPTYNNSKIAKYLIKKYNWSYNTNYIRQVVGDYKKIQESRDNIVTDQQSENEENQQVKAGLELRDDYVINWTNKTIITDLGEYGNYVASFDKHGLIQRMYVYDDGNETAAIVAMEHDFPHTKAVYKYAKIHGFSKASPPQTDLEFELGKGVEESVEENIQTMKRSVYKKTQKRKWKEIVTASEKWWNLEHTLLEEIKALTYIINDNKTELIPSIIPKDTTQSEFATVIGITDVHYMKLCYNHRGEVVYDREIAKKTLKEHTIKLAQEVSRYGSPSEFIVMLGNDNIHIDGTHHSTTKLTTQHQATDGLWRLELKNYIQMQIDFIEYYKQIAPVVVLPVKGNHDYETSMALHAFLTIYFRNDPMVNVIESYDDRVYYQYGKNCLLATHGDELGSIKNLESKAHQLILGEAKNYGIDIMIVEQYYVLHGHEHKESVNDLNGNVERIGFKSLSGEDDYWHKKNGYTGRSKGSMAMILSKDNGKKALLYV